MFFIEFARVIELFRTLYDSSEKRMGANRKAGVVGFRNGLVAQCDTGPLHQGANKEKYSLGKLGGGLGNATLTI